MGMGRTPAVFDRRDRIRHRTDGEHKIEDLETFPDEQVVEGPRSLDLSRFIEFEISILAAQVIEAYFRLRERSIVEISFRGDRHQGIWYGFLLITMKEVPCSFVKITKVDVERRDPTRPFVCERPQI